MKTAFLTSFNTDLLKRECVKYAEQNYHAQYELWWHDYAQYTQSVVNENSPLYSFNPDVVILHLEIESLIGDKYFDPLSISKDDWNSLLDNAKSSVRNIVNLLTLRIPKCRIICENFIGRSDSFLGTLDLNIPCGNMAIIKEMNSFLELLANEYKGRIFINDYSSLVSNIGRYNWFDSRMYRLAKYPFAYNHLSTLSAHYFKTISLLTFPRKKCIVADLDNTLWGGIIGQDGLENIVLGNSGIGEAYVQFQKLLLNYYRQGIFLTICSKNTYTDAIEAIEKHPDMVLRKEYFAAMKINWLDKVHNIKDIAKELNIGTDALVFIDDNPAECELVKQQMPEIEVLNLTGDPDNYIKQLLDIIPLQTLTLTAEDLSRNVMHHQDVKRKEFETAFTNMDDYYKSLGMKGYLCINAEAQISRIAQLTQKTNQFTTTTRRYSTEEIKNFIESGDYKIYTLRLEDKFGDNGIIAVAIVKCENEKWHLEAFLMSCRVIGRQAENLLLQSIIDDASEMGVKMITAEFYKTKKNAPAEKLLPVSGFIENSSGVFELHLPANKLNHFIEIIRD